MKFIEMFGGIGGFRLGMERYGHECVWYNDFDKYCVEIYNKNFNENYEAKDIRKVDEREIQKHDCICAGFPCQSFSIAGKRKGMEDTRGTLFFEICRIAKFHKPKMLFLENVRGLLSHDEGETFRIILESLWNLGYDVEWQVLNSKNYGVPQNRERVFIIGHFRGFGGRQIFPIRENENENFVLQTLTARYFASNSNGNFICYPKRQRNKKERNVILKMHRANEIRNHGQICPTLTESHEHFGGANVPIVANAVDCDGYLRKGERPRDENGKPQLLPIGYRRIRRLTPIECERLQGFHDDFTKGVSDSQRYKMLGNAVTINVIEEIAKVIKNKYY